MKTDSSLFDWKHLRLWKISSQAETLATIVFIIYFLAMFGQISQYNKTANTEYQMSLINMLSKNPVFILDMLVQMAAVLLQGAVYYLVLKGLALGLNMLIETDLNYRDKKNEEDEG